MIGVGDVIVAGRHSTDTLAAISIATAIISCITIMGIGVLGSISPILSNYRGAGKEPEKYFYPSLKFTLTLSVIMSLVILAFIPLIDKIGFEKGLTPIIKDYFFVTAFSTCGAYLHYMSKEILQAFEIVVFPNILTIKQGRAQHMIKNKIQN
jgi:MATE family multidrug resistance protein